MFSKLKDTSTKSLEMAKGLSPDSIVSNELLASSKLVNQTSKNVEVVLKKGLIAGTIGRIMAFPVKDDSTKFSKTGMRDYILEKVEEMPFHSKRDEPLLVQLGDTSAWGQTKRFFRKQKGEMGMIPRLYYGARIFFSKINDKLSRINNYDPNTDTVTLFNLTKARAVHELGHVVAGETKESPAEYYSHYDQKGQTQIQEWEASHNAMKLLNTKEERADIAPTLSGMFATYENLYGKKYDKTTVNNILGDSLEDRQKTDKNWFFDEEKHQSFKEAA